MNAKNIHSLAGNLILAASQFITQALLYRIVGANTVGSWVLFLAGLSFFEAIRSGIVQSSIVRFSAAAMKEDTAHVVGSAWLLSLLITLFLVCVNIGLFFASSHLEDEGYHLLARWFAPTMICTLPYHLTTWILQSQQRFEKITLLRVFPLFFNVIFLLICYFYLRLDLHLILFCYIASMIIASAFALLSGYSEIRLILKAKWKVLVNLFRFGVFTMGTTVGNILLRTSDMFIINSFLGSAVVAIYNIPQKIIDVIAIPVRSFSATAYPKMSLYAAKDDIAALTAHMKKFAGTLTVTLLPMIVGMAVFSDFIVTLLFGRAYISAGMVLKVFMIYAALLPLDQILAVTLDVLKRPHLTFIKTLIMIVVNIAGDLAGIYLFHNLLAVAAASIITFLIAITLGHVILRRYLTYHLNDIFKIGYMESTLALKAILDRFKRA